MNLEDWLHSYNLGFERFARLIHVGRESLHRYERGDPGLRDATRKKIKLGIRVVEKYSLVAPKWNPVFPSFDYLRFDRACREHQIEMAEYEDLFRELYQRELER